MPTSTKKLQNKQEQAFSNVGRAIGELRRGALVFVKEGSTIVMMSSLESLDSRKLLVLKKQTNGPTSLLVSRQRANTLNLKNIGSGAAAIILDDNSKIESILQIADPTISLKPNIKTLRARAANPVEIASIELAKYAHFLPAVLTKDIPISQEEFLASRNHAVVSTADIDIYGSAAHTNLRQVASANVPLKNSINSKIIAFRPSAGGVEHIAVIIGKPKISEPVMVRLHSQCFTGDLLDSLRCDCGQQLSGAIETISKSGSGVLLYLMQEGRGIGLVNKLRAYNLQDSGLNTFEANTALGFDDDSRHYRVAAEMLHLLGISTIKLLTNNPSKIKALESQGINVIERIQHSFESNEHNQNYLKSKTEIGGHIL